MRYRALTSCAETPCAGSVFFFPRTNEATFYHKLAHANRPGKKNKYLIYAVLCCLNRSFRRIQTKHSYQLSPNVHGYSDIKEYPVTWL